MAQYSRFVQIMKIALPVAAGILLIVVIGLPLIREQEDRFRIAPGADKNGTGKSLSMTNARYYGTDDKGQPYSLTAQNVRGGTGDKIIELTLPKAEITLNRRHLACRPPPNSGVYDRDKQMLDLHGDVALFQYEGNELHTSSAHITLKDGSRRRQRAGHRPGSFRHPRSQSAGLYVSDKDKVIHFTGPATHDGEPTGQSGREAASSAAPSRCDHRPRRPKPHKPREGTEMSFVSYRWETRCWPPSFGCVIRRLPHAQSLSRSGRTSRFDVTAEDGLEMQQDTKRMIALVATPRPCRATSASPADVLIADYRARRPATTRSIASSPPAT